MQYSCYNSTIDQLYSYYTVLLTEQIMCFYTHNKGNAVPHTTSIAARTESSTWLAVEHVRAFNRDGPKVSRNTRSSQIWPIVTDRVVWFVGRSVTVVSPANQLNR